MPAVGEIVPSHFSIGIVAASYFASLCGCLLTVELLHRRGTGVKSKRSWIETAACAIVLGAIGIWCMHFIGNRAIILGDGSDNLQLVYNPGFSTLSAFLPVLGLMVAFSTAERQYKTRRAHWVALGITGVASGFSVVAMHYVGNLGISNYHLHYLPQFLGGSMFIAVGDCLAVLTLFYTWREKWISRWWKRIMCASSLAAGISSMHFTASTNCVYRLKHYNKPEAVLSRNIQTAVAGILCGVAGVIVVCFLFFTRRRVSALKKTSQRVMLSSAMFHPDGRLLVTLEGVLPSKEITTKYNHRTFNEEFDTAHPVFHWIFRVTRNWAAVSDLIPKMKSHLNVQRADGEENSRPTSSDSSMKYDPETYSDYSVIFRERFCVAAASLASSMGITLNRMGVLYDHIIETGTIKVEDAAWYRSTLSGVDDVEMAVQVSTYGSGQLLFLTSQLTVEGADHLVNSGFRFATVQQVGRNIAHTMQIPLSTLEDHVASLQHYVDSLSNLQKQGTYLSCFAMIPKVYIKGGFNIAVRKSEQDQLPDVPMLNHDPADWQIAFLERMHNMAFNDCFVYLEHLPRREPSCTRHELLFSLTLIDAMGRLAERVPKLWLDEAVFYGKPLQAHYSQQLRSRAPITWLYSFVVLPDLHTSFNGEFSMMQTPISFFKVRQQCYMGSPNHVVLAQEIHQEFAPLLARKVPKATAKDRKLCISFMRSNAKPNNTCRPSATRGSSEDRTDSSRNSFGLNRQHDNQQTRAVQHDSQIESREGGWGGILVNSETVVESDSKSDYSINSGNNGLGMMTAVTTSGPEATFADELVAFVRMLSIRKERGEAWPIGERQ